MPLGRLHKRILCKWLLYDGEETQKSWKPMLNTIFALRGSSECSVQSNAHKFFVPSAKRHCREDLLTPESYMVKKQPWICISPAVSSKLYSKNCKIKYKYITPILTLYCDKSKSRPSIFPYCRYFIYITAFYAFHNKLPVFFQRQQPFSPSGISLPLPSSEES